MVIDTLRRVRRRFLPAHIRADIRDTQLLVALRLSEGRPMLVAEGRILGWIGRLVAQADPGVPVVGSALVMLFRMQTVEQRAAGSGVSVACPSPLPPPAAPLALPGS